MKVLFALVFFLASVFMTGATAQPAETSDREVQELLRSSKTIGKYSGRHTLDSISKVLRNALLRTESIEAQVAILERLSKLKMVLIDYDSAFWYNEQVRSILDSSKILYTKGEFKYYHRRGSMQRKFGDYDKALSSLETAMEYVVTPDDERTLLILQGLIYKFLKDFDAAKDRYQRAFQVNLETGDSASSTYTAFHIGMLLEEQNEYEAALKWLNRAESYKMTRDSEIYIPNLSGRIYIELGKYKEAAYKLNKVASKLTERFTKREVLARFWASAGKVLKTEYGYILEENIGNITPEEALEKAIIYVDESDRLDLRIPIYSSVAETYLEMGNEERGNDLMAIAEDLKNREYNLAVANGYKQESKLVQKRANKEIDQQELINQKQKDILLIVGAVALVMIAIAIMLYHRHKGQRVLNSELATENDEIVRANKILARIRKAATNGNSVEEQWLSGAKSMILQNITNISPASLADLLHVSKRTLNRQAKKVSDLTPEKLILVTKLTQAEELLTQHREKNISEVAYECGFSDAAHFSRAFKDHFGHTPSQFTEEVLKLKLYQ